jgi:RNA polymerase-binding protein DksA
MCYRAAPMSPAKRSSTSRSGTSKKTATTSKSKSSGRKSTSKKSASTRKKASTKKPAAKKTAAKTRARSGARKPAARKSTAKQPSRTTTRKASSRKAPARASTRTGATRAPTRRAAKPAKLDRKALEEIRATLERERTDLRRQEQGLEQDSFEGTQSDITGEVGLDEDFADAGTATFDRERDLSIRNNIRDLIDQITRAIARIDEGTYGSCERCGRPIDAARLKALPHALLCMDCKRREERAR